MVRIKLKNIKKDVNKTINECHAEYIEYCVAIGQREKTIESKMRFYKYVLPKVINISESITELTKDKIEDYIVFMRRNGYKGNTYQTFVIKLRAFLTFCFMRNYLEKFQVKIPTVDLEKKVVYTEEELNKLLKRPNLNSCLVGEYKSWVTINFRHMKTRRQITVPLSQTLKVVVKEYIQIMGLSNSDLLFPKLNGEKMNYDTLHQNTKNFFSSRKVKFHGINTFRNTFATMFIKNQGDIYRLKVILGHSDIKTTERYINLLPIDLKDDICRFNPLDILNKKTQE